MFLINLIFSLFLKNERGVRPARHWLRLQAMAGRGEFYFSKHIMHYFLSIHQKDITLPKLLLIVSKEALYNFFEDAEVASFIKIVSKSLSKAERTVDSTQIFVATPEITTLFILFFCKISNKFVPINESCFCFFITYSFFFGFKISTISLSHVFS